MHKYARQLLERKAEERLRHLKQEVGDFKSRFVQTPGRPRYKYYETLRDLSAELAVVSKRLDELTKSDGTEWDSYYSMFDEAYDEVMERLARTRFLIA
ncbi:MAG: hypothetical protein HYY23_11690 [Verrucomicrobia bacterium]|nr:hypothetical protein [Verrucomicrobiota bacterium]